MVFRPTRIFLPRIALRFWFFALVALAYFAYVVTHRSMQAWFARTRLTSLGPQQSMRYPPYPTPLDTPSPAPSETVILPPLYQRYMTYENTLPQHNETLPFPEGSGTKFIYFANHAWGAGWGNILQEMLLDAHLAYASGRAFVFDNYTWDRNGDYSDYKGKLIPSRIPLSTLVAGPLVGYPFTNLTTALMHPRAVSWHYYHSLCPEPYIIDADLVNKTMTPHDATALEVMNIWTGLLRHTQARCVEIKKDTAQIFDIWLFGSPRLHNIMPTLLDSPIIKDFTWSPLIHYAFQKNQHYFTSTHRRRKTLFEILFPFFSSRTEDPSSRGGLNNDQRKPSLIPTASPGQAETLPILALHLRRGDFVQHCDRLLGWRTNYFGFNTLPSLPDRFFAENSTLLNELSQETIKEGYRRKCLVDVDLVRKRVVRAVREWRNERLKIEREHDWLKKWLFGSRTADREKIRVKKMLRKIYIMTNGEREFLEELKAGLHDDALRSSTTSDFSMTNFDDDYDFVWDWDEISTSRDLEWGWETKYVAQAMDMYVGQRAELFIGNGFSSLTANVVLMRFAAGVEPWRTRFW